MKSKFLFLFLLSASTCISQTYLDRIFYIDKFNSDVSYLINISEGKRNTSFLTLEKQRIDSLIVASKKTDTLCTDYFLENNFSIYMSNYLFSILLTNGYGNKYYSDKKDVKFTFSNNNIGNLDTEGEEIYKCNNFVIKQLKKHTYKLYLVDMIHYKNYSIIKDVKFSFYPGRYIKIVNVVK